MCNTKYSPKDSEHKDFYSGRDAESLLDKTEKKYEFEQSENRPMEEKRDDLYKFKKNVSLTRNYELYLETEKAYYKFTKEKLNWSDPMERLARKIKRDEHLYLRDLKTWIGYNFLVFNEDEQDKIRKLNERQIWFWKYLTLLSIPYWMGGFAVTRYHFNWGAIRSGLFSFAFIAGLS